MARVVGLICLGLAFGCGGAEDVVSDAVSDDEVALTRGERICDAMMGAAVCHGGAYDSATVEACARSIDSGRTHPDCAGAMEATAECLSEVACFTEHCDSLMSTGMLVCDKEGSLEAACQAFIWWDETCYGYQHGNGARTSCTNTYMALPVTDECSHDLLFLGSAVESESQACSNYTKVLVDDFVGNCIADF